MAISKICPRQVEHMSKIENNDNIRGCSLASLLPSSFLSPFIFLYEGGRSEDEVKEGDEVRVCILRIEGTNCEWETCLCFTHLNASAEIVHLKQLTGEHSERRNLEDYDILVLPGGFSAGDYVRAGAIFAARMRAIWRDLCSFVDAGKPVLGICNGFQVLVELGLLPGWDEKREVALTLNDSARFECRLTILKHENRGKCVFTKDIPQGSLLRMPCAHAEGKFFVPAESKERVLLRLEENDQIVFRYSDAEGRTVAGYPWNPNGSFSNIAGICNPAGNVFGLMPHPERAFFAFQTQEWARKRAIAEAETEAETETKTEAETGEETEAEIYGDGKRIFECVLEHVRRFKH